MTPRALISSRRRAVNRQQIEALNDNIVGEVELIAEYRPE